MLVTTGSAAFTVGAARLAEVSAAAAEGNPFDPTRVIQGIVGGIGFLGAGAIVHSRGSVEGLTTAAGVWAMGAVGVACGLGYYDLALATTFLAFLIMGVLGMFEHHRDPTPSAPEK
jgi:putative Mg2+ transporter-C (MgtC) family protein